MYEQADKQTLIQWWLYYSNDENIVFNADVDGYDGDDDDVAVAVTGAVDV